MRKRIGVVVLMIVPASLWITPLHEAAHQLAGILAGGDPEGFSFWFQGPLLVGETYNSLFATGSSGEFFATAGPIFFLYIPATMVLWVRRKNGGLLSLALAILAGQGGLYTALGLVRTYGDSWALVELGVPTWTLTLLAVFFLGMAAKMILRYVRVG